MILIISLVFVLGLYSCLVVGAQADREMERLFEEEEERRKNALE